jgi:ubiquitin C-terminal hydrolase
MTADQHVAVVCSGLEITLYCDWLFRYSKDDPFIALTIDIRNHQNLIESLDQFVKGDLLEGANAYHCDKCNKKVSDIFSRIFFSSKFVIPCHIVNLYRCE